LRQVSTLFSLFQQDLCFSKTFEFVGITADSCAGATIQYFYDDACTLFAGSSEISLATQSCHASTEGKTFTSLTCSAKAVDTTAIVTLA
jgi:hypothetical protein